MKITTEQDYQATMQRIDLLMGKGSGNLSQNDEAELGYLAVAAQDYEQTYIYEPAPPETKEGQAELQALRERLR
jgi:hypothetical protein